MLRTDPKTLGARARALRLIASGIGMALLVAGTVVGQDDDFPFGPFRMYSTSNRTTGNVTVLSLEARTATSGWFEVQPVPATVGMNRAEFEGQQPRFIEHPELLGAVANSYHRLNPAGEPWTELRLIREATEVVDRVPTGEVTEEVLAEWKQS